MSQEADTLRHLVQVLNTGEEFYQRAKDRITDTDLQHFLDANIADKRRLREKLQTALKEQSGSREEGSDLGARLEEYRADLKTVLQSNDARVYMDHLEDLEDKTLDAFERVRSTADSEVLRKLLDEMDPDFRYMHERMRTAEGASGGRETPKTMPTRLMRH